MVLTMWSKEFGSVCSAHQMDAMDLTRTSVWSVGHFSRMQRLDAVLKGLRVSNGLSLREAARRAGISTSTLSRIESGERRNPSWETVWRLAQTYGISASQLRALSRQGGPNPPPTPFAVLMKSLGSIRRELAELRRAIAASPPSPPPASARARRRKGVRRRFS